MHSALIATLTVIILRAKFEGGLQSLNQVKDSILNWLEIIAT